MTIDAISHYGFEETYVPVVRPDALIRSYENEGIAWSPVHPAPAYLDPVAATVVQILDGRATIGELVADVHEALAVPEDLAAAQIARVVHLLRETALLTDSIVDPTESTSGIFHDPPNT